MISRNKTGSNLPDKAVNPVKSGLDALDFQLIANLTGGPAEISVFIFKTAPSVSGPRPGSNKLKSE